ncbi:MAG: hypothetical protein KAH77_10285 [Thiomargarita sp.]|nr:hypothetical protein [Thiomargarita sp.]
MNKHIFILFVLIFIGCDHENTVEPVTLFVNDINPELYRTMIQMNQERVLVENKIIRLSELKDRYPNQRQMINRSLDQWRPLLKNLNETVTHTNNQVEDAYVAYKINEIQGRNQFSLISKTLLKDAHAVLAKAAIIKSTIENALHEN